MRILATKIKTIFFLILALCAVSAAAYADYDTSKWVPAQGYMLVEDQYGAVNAIRFREYREFATKADPIKYTETFRCVHEGIEKFIPVKEIKSIKLALTPKQFAAALSMDRFRNLVLAMKDHRMYHVSVHDDMGFSLNNTQHLELHYFDPITQTYKVGGFDTKKIREIVFE